MTLPTAKDLNLPWVDALVDEFIDKYYGNEDDPTLPRVWAWACVAEYARDQGFGIMAMAVDRQGYTHADLAYALGVTRQAVQQRLLRSKRGAIREHAPDKRQQRLPL